jgi:hypothetical protein
MSAKEAILEMLQDLPAEVSLGEILQGIENIAARDRAARDRASGDSQVSALRASPEAAAILSRALAAHRAGPNDSAH